MAESDLRHRLTAILAADAAGYSRLMAADERATLAALDAARTVFRDQTEANAGRVVDTAGDSVLAVFETVTGAVTAALDIQRALAKSTLDIPEDRCLRFRVGIHLGDVIEKSDGTVYGDGVNIAARLQALAEPGGVTVSESVRIAVRGKLRATFEDQGERAVKNIAEPVRMFKVMIGEAKVDPITIAHAVARVSEPVPGFGGLPAIAVLPFENMSGDPEQEYFADGLAEDILTRLAMWRWVPVIARNSSSTFRGQSTDVREVGRALGARYVLEGSVRKAAPRVRVTAQLIDAHTGHHIWAERYDRDLADIFAAQDELTDGIVGVLESVVGRSEAERARLRQPQSLDAWEWIARGFWHFQRFTRQDFALAVDAFRQAIRIDAAAALAHVGLAYVRMTELALMWAPSPPAAFIEAVMHARHGLAADPQLADAHALLGWAALRTGKFDEGLAMCRRAVELNPSSANVNWSLAAAHLVRSEGEACVLAVETAMRLSPHDSLAGIRASLLSAGHYTARQYEKAAEFARHAVQWMPDYPLGWRALANALGQLGQLDAAREALAQFLLLMPSYTSEQAARLALPFRDEEAFQHYLEGLRKAGWSG